MLDHHSDQINQKSQLALIRMQFYQSIKNSVLKEGFTTMYIALLKVRIHQINTLHTIASFQSVG